MVRPDPQAFALAPSFVPRLGFRPRGRTGERLGPGVGASLEFEDRRAYSPGDDLRHVDWRVLARTDELLVRVHREEIQPRLDVLLDGSRSMASEPEKAQTALDLAVLFAASGAAAGFRVRPWLLGAEPRLLPLDELRAEGVEFEALATVGESLASARTSLAPGSLRILISDFLSPDAPGLATLVGAGGSAALVQVLGPWELDPTVGEEAKLVDAETGAARDLSLDQGLVTAYRARLERLVDELVDESRRLGLRYVQVPGGTTLQKTARDLLLPAGLLEPA